MNTTSLTIAGKLPVIPVTLHPIVGSGLIENRLQMAHGGRGSPEEAMAVWRNEHSSERSPFRCMFYMEPQKGNTKKANVMFRLGFNSVRAKAVGVTDNDPLAARLLIANARANHYMTSIRWELYGDRQCEDLLDMGRFDQWDFLKDVSPGQLAQLAERNIAPRGNWDFDKLLWEQACSICGTKVMVNYHIFNIDSVVCAECGNRPFLAPSLHRMIEDVRDIQGNVQAMTLHALQWLSGVGANFKEVRRDSSDPDGQRIRLLAEHSLIWKATDRGSENEVRALIERNTELDFGMYQGACAKVRKALCGEEVFREEHQIAAQFVLRSTELLRVRQLTTSTE
jgi:hypothetical protein